MPRRGDSPQTPVSLRPFQLILPRDHLFGDWYGAAIKAGRTGFTPTLSFVTDIVGNPSGGRDQGVTHADNLGLDLLFDLDKLVGLKGGSLLVSMSQRSGSSLSREYVGNVFTLSRSSVARPFISLMWPTNKNSWMKTRFSCRPNRHRRRLSWSLLTITYSCKMDSDGNPVGIFSTRRE